MFDTTQNQVQVLASAPKTKINQNCPERKKRLEMQRAMGQHFKKQNINTEVSVS